MNFYDISELIDKIIMSEVDYNCCYAFLSAVFPFEYQCNQNNVRSAVDEIVLHGLGEYHITAYDLPYVNACTKFLKFDSFDEDAYPVCFLNIENQEIDSDYIACALIKIFSCVFNSSALFIFFSGERFALGSIRSTETIENNFCLSDWFSSCELSQYSTFPEYNFSINDIIYWIKTNSKLEQNPKEQKLKSLYNGYGFFNLDYIHALYEIEAFTGISTKKQLSDYYGEFYAELKELDLDGYLMDFNADKKVEYKYDDIASEISLVGNAGYFDEIEDDIYLTESQDIEQSESSLEDFSTQIESLDIPEDILDDPEKLLAYIKNMASIMPNGQSELYSDNSIVATPILDQSSDLEINYDNQHIYFSDEDSSENMGDVIKSKNVALRENIINHHNKLDNAEAINVNDGFEYVAEKSEGQFKNVLFYRNNLNPALDNIPNLNADETTINMITSDVSNAFSDNDDVPFEINDKSFSADNIVDDRFPKSNTDNLVLRENTVSADTFINEAAKNSAYTGKTESEEALAVQEEILDKQYPEQFITENIDYVSENDSVDINNMISHFELISLVSVHTETILKYIRDGKIVPDAIVDMGARSKYYFTKKNVKNIIKKFNWTVINQENRRRVFFDMVGKMTMSFSYKPVFIKAFFNSAKDGKAHMNKIVTYFKEFYEDRRGKGVCIEKPTSIFAKGGYSDKDIKRLILIYPYKRFAEMQIFKYSVVFNTISMDNDIWKRLKDSEIETICQMCDEHIEKYYSRLK